MNKIVHIPANMTVSWYGHYSACMRGGALEQFVNNELANRDAIAIFHQSDAVVSNLECDKLEIEAFQHSQAQAIIITLCTRAFQRDNLLLLPLDDSTFEHGLMFQNLPSWEERAPVVFWRGVPSGDL